MEDLLGNRRFSTSGTGKNENSKFRLRAPNSLKSIYHAPNEEAGFKAMETVSTKWEEKYPRSMRP